MAGEYVVGEHREREVDDPEMARNGRVYLFGDGSFRINPTSLQPQSTRLTQTRTRWSWAAPRS
jgi:hypothetical protein